MADGINRRLAWSAIYQNPKAKKELAAKERQRHLKTGIRLEVGEQRALMRDAVNQSLKRKRRAQSGR